MSNNICAAEGCSKEKGNSSYCSMHYSRLQRNGTLELKPKIIRTCSVDGCEKKYLAKDYCKNHYHAFSKYGDPLLTYKQVKPLKVIVKCSVDECDRDSKIKGFCKLHYDRFLKHGDPLKVIKQHKTPCIVDGCKYMSHAHGYCSIHLGRVRRHGDPHKVIFKHHWKHNTPEYRIWADIKSRCFNHKRKCFHSYGGRGITICDRWKNSFIDFYDDMGPRPDYKSQIDRIDNDGNYEPGNCRWTTRTVNARNKSTTKLTIILAREIRDLYFNHSERICDLARSYNVSEGAIYGVIKETNWKEEDTPSEETNLWN